MSDTETPKGNYQVSFRAMTEDDIPHLETIQKACHTDKQWDEGVIEHLLDESPNMHGRVLELQQITEFKEASVKLIVGSAVFQKLDGRLFITDIVVVPNFQRKGFGKYMVNKLKGMLSTERRPVAFTVVNEHNMDAIKFLASQQFRGTKLHPQLFNDADGIEMVYDSRRQA